MKWSPAALLVNAKTIITAVLLALLSAAYIALKMSRQKNVKLEATVKHYEVKEEADEVRAKPVVRNKSAILDRM